MARLYSYIFVYDGIIEQRPDLTMEEVHAQAKQLSTDHNCEVKVCGYLKDGTLVWKFSYIYGRCLIYE